ncbi:hypothetical protein Rs2_23158 [Raphanus sativus]|nr:hypothetical protein Rs2_23158 [Raphanus sativus]
MATYGVQHVVPGIVLFPADVQEALVASCLRDLHPHEWLLMFQNVEFFSAPVNPYLILINTVGLWRVDNPYMFELRLMNSCSGGGWPSGKTRSMPRRERLSTIPTS